MAKQSAEERAHTAKLQAEAREADARAKLAGSRREVTELLRDVLTDVSRTPNVAPARDRLGAEKPIRKFNALTWVKIVPGVVARFRSGNAVPDEFWSKDLADDGTPLAVISCQCGAEPVVPFANFTFCDGEDCRRAFLFEGKVIYAIRLSEEEWDVLQEDPDA